MTLSPLNRRLFISAAVASTLAFGGCKEWGNEGRKQSNDAGARTSIGLVVTSIDNPYFVEMADAASRAAGAPPAMPLVLQAPERGAVDPERQQQLIESLIARRTSVLLVVPADSTQVISSIQGANRANIPIIILDNDINNDVAQQRGARIAAFIGSDNVAGGQLAGDFIRQQLRNGGNVAILEGLVGVQAATDRKAGFMASVSQQPSIKIVASQAADWDREKGYSVTKGILAANPNLRAIFAANDEMALGAAKALRETRRRNVLLVGYDATPDGRSAVRDGRMAATIAQQPKEVGRLGVEYARQILTGNPVPARTKVPLRVVAHQALDAKP